MPLVREAQAMRFPMDAQSSLVEAVVELTIPFAGVGTRDHGLKLVQELGAVSSGCQ